MPGTTTPGAGSDPQEGLLQLAFSGLLLKAVRAAVELGVVDLLVDGPRTAADLAGKVGAVPAKLAQLLRALTIVGVMTVDEERFALGPAGVTLVSGHPSANRELFLVMGGPAVSQALEHLPEVLSTGQTGVDIALGMPLFDYLQAHPDQGALFNRMMLAVHGAEPAAVADAYDFASVTRLVDVGGGIGTMLVAVLSRHPALQGVHFDLPSVGEQARTTIATAGLIDRCTFDAGSFFDRVPAGADAYLLSHIIHDWDEAACLAILRRCREAMDPAGRLLLVEMVLPDDDAPHPGKILDLAMMSLVGGRERTAGEYGELLAAAGFRLEQVVPTATPVSVVEARVAD